MSSQSIMTSTGVGDCATDLAMEVPSDIELRIESRAG
jgi:hypothetical protein